MYSNSLCSDLDGKAVTNHDRLAPWCGGNQLQLSKGATSSQKCTPWVFRKVDMALSSQAYNCYWSCSPYALPAWHCICDLIRLDHQNICFAAFRTRCCAISVSWRQNYRVIPRAWKLVLQLIQQVVSPLQLSWNFDILYRRGEAATKRVHNDYMFFSFKKITLLSFVFSTAANMYATLDK